MTVGAVDMFERFLGDPFDPGSPFSFAGSVAADERDELPAGTLARLVEWGFSRAFVPQQFGGTLGSWDELLGLVRSLARRDPALVLAFGTGVLGALPVWMWGDDEQRRGLAEQLVGGALGSFALSEAAHGSDLTACELVARRTATGYVLDGEKWPIGNARRGAFATVFARTGDGPRGFTLFHVGKQHLAGCELPRARTLGVRGHDLGGFRFAETAIPEGARVGREGLGLEYTLLSLQITRTLVAGLSLGVADSALAIAARWAHERRLYGRAISTLQPIRELLVGALVDRFACERVAISAARAITIAPGVMPLWSCITKYFVPVTCDQILRDVAVVLGARHYLREGLADGVFQKLQRDHAIASVFEGTTLVNLERIARDLPGVLARPPLDEPTLAGVFSTRSPAPAWNPCEVALRLAPTTGALATSPEGRDDFERAQRYTALHAAACCRLSAVHDAAPRELVSAALDRLAGRRLSTTQVDVLWPLVMELQ